MPGTIYLPNTVDVSSLDTRLLGRVKVLDSGGAVIDPATKGQLPAALAAGGGLKVEGVAGGVAQPVSGTVDTELPAAAAMTDADPNPTAPDVAARLSGFDATNWRRVRVDANGRLQVTGAGAPGDAGSLSSAVLVSSSMYNGASWDRVRGSIANGLLVDVSRSALPTGASTEATLAGVKTGTDKIPASPATDRTTAAAPFAVRQSDGAAFYDTAKTGQLPSALVGGRLDVNIGAPATLPVSLATNTPDVTDRAARLLGHVTVDAGDVDHDAVNTAKVQQVGGHASPVDVPPTAVSAAGDRVRAWLDRTGAAVTRDRKIRETYTAVFRLAETAARLDQTFTQVANTNKQWATLHHAAAATKEVRLQKCIVWITGWTTVAMQAVLELRQLSSAPATGNPSITPTPRRRGGTAAEAVCMYLPTTAGGEAAVNQPLAHIPFDYGVMGAVSTLNPLDGNQFGPGAVILYDSSQEDPEAMQPVLPVATLDGWAVCLRSVGAPVVRLTCMMVFTEEIP